MDCLSHEITGEFALQPFQPYRHPSFRWHDGEYSGGLISVDHAQAIDLERILFDQVSPPGRNAR
jgi:hypothetical protein